MYKLIINLFGYSENLLMLLDIYIINLVNFISHGENAILCANTLR